MPMSLSRESRSAVVMILIGGAIGAVLAMAVGIVSALLRPETSSVLRPWWR
ncbi:MAG TPA: YtxH domain-containing protein [Chloroflexia bacterium]|nr:YtxH domain-containing protein [Chloroflexia bacterium]